MNYAVSIVIPTLDEEFSIRQTLDALRVFDENIEIIIVDGGSRDATGDVLWFLHADTVPAPNCVRQLKRCLQNENVVGGNFTIRFDGERLAAKFLTWLYPKLNTLNLIYGDSAIFVRRDIYERIGGFNDYPIFEDLDFIERLKRAGEVVTLPAVVTTSSRRFENKSFILTFLRWTILQMLYWLGVSPDALVKIYFPK